MNIDFYLLGCVCFGFKLILEMLFRKIGCLVGSENWVKVKMFSVSTVKQEQWGKKYILSLFSLQIISEDAQRKKGLTDAQTCKQRERERERELKHEHTHKTQITPHLSQAPASLAKLRSCQPTA